MAETFTVELDDKGNIGKLPDALQTFLDTRINDAFKRGAEKVEKELKPKLRSEADEERLKLLAEENQRFKEDEAKRKGDHDEAKRLAEERHAAAIKEREDKLAAAGDEITRRDSRLRQMLGSEVRAAAVAAGARAESLPELVKLLGAELDLDPKTLEPFVKDKDGKPAMDKDGKAVSIEGFVTQYLADHPHHFAKPGGKSGRAPGGATMRGASHSIGSDKDQAIAAAEENPTIANVSTAVGAMRSSRSK